MTPIRKNYSGVMIVNMDYSAEEAANGIEQGKFDAVAFETSYLANPALDKVLM